MIEVTSVPLTADGHVDERAAFAACYPSIRWEDIPDSVKQKSAEEHLPITAVYGDYLSHREEMRRAAASALVRGRERSPGLPRGATGERLYSIEEMRAMPQTEVRSRYGSLLASLRHGVYKK